MKFKLASGHDSELAAKIREVMGIGPNEECEVTTPQFERTDGRTPWFFPEDTEALDALKTAPEDLLRSMCLCPWDEDDNIWLFPGEWYDYIPEGYIVTDICGDDEPFRHGEFDDDIRFGCLAYGFRAAPINA